MVDRYVPASELPLWAARGRLQQAGHESPQKTDFVQLTKEEYQALSDTEKEQYKEQERQYFRI